MKELAKNQFFRGSSMTQFFSFFSILIPAQNWFYGFCEPMVKGQIFLVLVLFKFSLWIMVLSQSLPDFSLSWKDKLKTEKFENEVIFGVFNY